MPVPKSIALQTATQLLAKLAGLPESDFEETDIGGPFLRARVTDAVTGEQYHIVLGVMGGEIGEAFGAIFKKPGEDAGA